MLSLQFELARGYGLFNAVVGSSHNFIPGISFNLTSEISLITALKDGHMN